MKKVFCYAALALFFAGAATSCDNFNVSLDEYIEDATGRAVAVGYTVQTVPHKDDGGGVVVLPPADAASPEIVSALEVALNNPRNYDVIPSLEGFYLSQYAGLEMSAAAEGPQKVNVSIRGAKHGDEASAIVNISADDRLMSSYTLPKLIFHYLDADLASLKYQFDTAVPDALTEVALFEPGKTDYTLDIPVLDPAAAASIYIEAVPRSPHAKAAVNGTDEPRVELVSNRQEITIAVNSCQGDAGGITKTYTLTVNRRALYSNEITAFRVTSPAAAEGVVVTPADSASGTVSVEAPAGTALSNMTVSVEHTGNSVTLDGQTKTGSPAEFSGIDFSQAKTFTVTAANGETRAYTVTVSSAIEGEPAARNTATGQKYATLAEAIQKAAVSQSTTVIEILRNIEAPDGENPGYLISGKHIQLTAPAGANYSIKLAPEISSPLFTVSFYSSLTLGGDGGGRLSLDGGGAAALNGRQGVLVSGTLTLNKTAAIKGFRNNSSEGGGGGVSVAGGTLIMNGGAITNNSAKTNGGGVAVIGGKFTMNGGSIANNTADGSGGGVFLGGGTFKMNGGTMATNRASSPGGGVRVEGGGSFTMNGGKIFGFNEGGSSNIGGIEPGTSEYSASLSLSSGSAVYGTGITGTDTTMDILTAGQLASNETLPAFAARIGTNKYYFTLAEAIDAATRGRADNLEEITVLKNIVLPEAGAASGYEISGRHIRLAAGAGSSLSITFYGGGTDLALFTVPDGASLALGKTGGGTLSLDGGEGDVSVYRHRGIRVAGGKFVLDDGAVIKRFRPQIEGGGGVYVASGEFVMEGGSIEQNMTGGGGGVYITAGGTFTMNGGSISNNTANNGGGVYVDGGTFTMTDGYIRDNTASISRGGDSLYVRMGTAVYGEPLTAAGTTQNILQSIPGGTSDTLPAL